MTREALRRVLQNLITSERRAHSLAASIPATPWADDFSLSDGVKAALGCDSLDLLQIASAVNEMFHLHEVHLQAELLQSLNFGDWIRIVEAAWTRGVQHITVSTSGSSGRPKYCAHPFPVLNIEVDTLATLFSGRSRIVACTPAHHLYGLLFTALLADRLAVPVQHLWSPTRADASAIDGNMSLQPGDLVVSFPEGWKWIERNMQAIPPNVEGVVSTAPCPRDLITALVDGRLAGMTEVYGSSETAGIGTRRWPEEAYTLMPHWHRSVSPGSPSAELQHTLGFSVEPMDHLRFVEDRRFFVEGRVDFGVQVGGVNVFPRILCEKLRTHPGVGEASVRLMRPEEGNRLKCFIVPKQDQGVEELERSLTSWIETWPTAERPRGIKFGATLPVGELGKPADW